MDDTITLDGISSASKGVRVIDWSIPLSARRERQTETLPGRLTSLKSEYATQAPADVTLTLAIVADGQAAALAAYLSAARWLWRGTRLELSVMPSYWYDGETTQIEIKELCDAYMTFGVTFSANPPYALRAQSKQTGFIPSSDAPIPEQITADTETCGVTLTASGSLPAVTLSGMETPAMYLCATGTWDALTIGSLTIAHAASTSMTVYIDCEAQEVYTIAAGVRASLMGDVSGDFPTLVSSQVTVGGTNLSATVRLLAVERG